MDKIFIKYMNPTDKVLVSFDYYYYNRHENDYLKKQRFNSERKTDEPIINTFRRIFERIESLKLENAKKKVKIIEQQQLQQRANDEKDDEIIEKIQLFDKNVEKPISPELKHREAWREGFKLKIENKFYEVAIDFPEIESLSLPTNIYAGLPTLVTVEKSFNVDFSKTKFIWYHSKLDYDDCHQSIDDIEWTECSESVGDGRFCFLDAASCVNKLIKVKTEPTDGERVGFSVEAISSRPCLPCPDLVKFPMTTRHLKTRKHLNDNELRVVTFNILGKSFTDDKNVRQSIYSYCKEDYLDFSYRRIFLHHEILNYNADIVFLQECSKEFYANELEYGLSKEFTAKFKGKNGQEGEAVLFRNKKFRFVDTFDIALNAELQTNPIFTNLWLKIERDAELSNKLKQKCTVLQLVQVEDVKKPGNHLLLANTHLYYHPKADLIRLIQSIVCMKHIEATRNRLLDSNPASIKSVHVIFGGDFNASSQSSAFSYLANRKVPLNKLQSESELILFDSRTANMLKHSICLATEVSNQISHCTREYQGTIDHVFFDRDSFDFKRAIETPSREQILANVALPSQHFPSDHLAVVIELTKSY